jgi:GAF domain-containing protein
VLKGLIVEQRVKQDYPALELVLLPDARTALVELSAGKIDVYIENMPIVAYNIDNLKLTNLKIAAQTPYIYDMAFGVRKDWPLLASALDKALASLSKEERNAITSRWASIEYQPGVNWRAVVPMGGAFLLVVVFVLIWNRRLRRAVRERKRIEEELRENARMLEAGGALKARLSQIAVELQKATSFEALAQTFMSQAAALTGFVYGAFYLLDEPAGLLRAIGGYGRMEAQTGLRHFEIGQGLAGQCALEKKPLRIADSESAQIRITWGGGHIDPGEILLLPVLQLGQVLAVIELGALKHFTDEQRAFLDDLMPTLALNIVILRRNMMTEELFAKSQAQALDLAASEQQLRARKEELESQQELLLAQRQELAAGKDALAQTAQELEEFNRVMIGRESRVIELKEEINALCARLGIPPTYPPVWDEAAASPGQGQEV